MGLYRDVLKMWQEMDIRDDAGLETALNGQIVLYAYHSGRIENDEVTYEATREVFERGRLSSFTGDVRTVFEIEGARRAMEFFLRSFGQRRRVDIPFIKELHRILKTGTADSRREWFTVGSYKRLPNEVGGKVTAAPDQVAGQMKKLISSYASLNTVTLEDIIAFHCDFEAIHPFQDGNGRVGRLIMLKECLKHGIVPFIITDEMKLFYYRGLQNWQQERGWLTDTILTAQDQFKAYLDYFQIPYK